MQRTIHILILGSGNESSATRLKRICTDDLKSGGSHGLVAYPDVTLVPTLCESITEGIGKVAELLELDIVYVRSSDGRDLDELAADMASLAEAMSVHACEPWITLGPDEGSVSDKKCLRRFEPIFQQANVEVANRYFNAIFRNRLAYQDDPSSFKRSSAA